jgi:orotidine-5'-phosphate decarboxylase
LSDAHSPLIIALDVESADEALSLVEKIGPAVGFYKVGMELYAAAGMSLVKQISGMGRQVFLDLKLYDIGETVKRATKRICSAAAPAFLTVHGSRSVMQAAVEGRGDAPTKLLAVTVLTSFDQEDLADLGYATPISDLVDLRVKKARESWLRRACVPPARIKAIRSASPPRPKHYATGPIIS